jgi:hypothetical protein
MSMSHVMRQLARLLLAVVVLPALLLPEGGTYCLRLLIGDCAPQACTHVAACCCCRHDAPTPASGLRASRDDAGCCVALPDSGRTIDAAAKSVDTTRRLDAGVPSHDSGLPIHDWMAALVPARAISSFTPPRVPPRPTLVLISLPLRL